MAVWQKGGRFVALALGAAAAQLGFGTAGLGARTGEMTTAAFQAGFRVFDSAQAGEWYAEDAVIGALHAQGVLDQAVVVTKVHPRDYHRVAEAVQETQNLMRGVPIGQVLLHSPMCWPGHCDGNPNWVEADWRDAWRQLEDLYLDGTVQSIGVSNFDAARLGKLLEVARIRPSIVQNHCNPLRQDKETRQLCAQKHIAYSAFSLFGTQWRGVEKNPVLAHPAIQGLATKYNEHATQIVLAWALQSDIIALTKSTSQHHIRSNARWLFSDPFRLEENEMHVLSLLDGTVAL